MFTNKLSLQSSAKPLFLWIGAMSSDLHLAGVHHSEIILLPFLSTRILDYFSVLGHSPCILSRYEHIKLFIISITP